MKRVLTALVLIPLVLTMVFLGKPWLVTLFTACLAGLAAWEYLGLTEAGGARPPRIAVLLAVLALFVGNYEYPDLTIYLFSGLSLILLVYCTFRLPVQRVVPDAAVSVFCLAYIGLALLALPALREYPNGPTLVTFLLCVVWAGDTVALYVGRLLGKHKLAPRLSPNKTWEGSVGSMLGSLLAACALMLLERLLAVRFNSAKLSFPDEVWYWMVLAVVVNIAAQVGDLAESALKRSVGVKDSGTLLPGHGGVLDRIDALLLAAPVLWFAQVLHQRF
jgi:phosphatidate cytidylyltransferase